ncbi:carbon-nitrogen hydrolase family protein [Halobacteriovorax sp. JY17]|uniref:carbon-nitrogen hydrolase family protein n=1 Tax=Halobacteriovorax sp. JY17 TaxID=2014617 RepID=UPI000C3D53EE|nr:carbon-nitrogen hydrolase family protein [Halobacteriovorax sp. JY17]PIK14020.1 MAG: carbon-nitrogen hydrolase [Halobacteriovorax sp. JY17]
MKSDMKLEVRQAEVTDIKGIMSLIKKAYRDLEDYSKDIIRGQITNFPEGHFVATMNDEIVGYSASILLKEQVVLAPHTWISITGGGYGSTHDEDGDYLYGYEVCVDPDIRGHRIGQRFYNARKRLVQFYRLKGIVFAGRVPNFKKKRKQVPNIEEYVEKVINKEIKDSSLGFQLRNGFEVIGILKDYLPSDKASLGYGIHLKWSNPGFNEVPKSDKGPIEQNVVRVVCVQYQQRGIKSFEEFESLVEYYVDVTADYRADFVLFPELFTMQLLSIKNEEIAPNVAIEHMTSYTEQVKELFRRLAVKYNVNIIAGSHPTKVDDKVRNISYICLRDGQVHEQAKIHPTPDEKYWWSIEGGEEVKVIDTDCGPIGVLICYDSEFPELSRHLANQGVNILFVPFLTDNRQAYCRVKYCCQARAVENQMYVAMAGNVGNLPRVHNVDIQYAQSCILTPCDFPFAKDGVAADTTPNVEMVAIADLRLDILREARQSGAVRNLKDRRHDLYSVVWHNKD